VNPFVEVKCSSPCYEPETGIIALARLGKSPYDNVHTNAGDKKSLCIAVIFTTLEPNRIRMRMIFKAPHAPTSSQMAPAYISILTSPLPVELNLHVVILPNIIDPAPQLQSNY
jgi:hypothetical protein